MKMKSVCICGQPYRYSNAWPFYMFRKTCAHGKQRVVYPTRGQYKAVTYPDGNTYSHWHDGPWAMDFLDVGWRKRLDRKHRKRSGVRRKRRLARKRRRRR